MAEKFVKLSAKEQGDALGVASTKSGRPAYLLEKDVWVVAVLAALFESEFGEHLVFKGGTSLSKAYRAIDRFSEDIDITYDIREIIADLIEDPNNPLPKSRSQAEKWSKAVKDRLAVWAKDKILPIVKSYLEKQGLKADLRADGEKLSITYKPTVEGYDYVPARVLVEFGARSTGEPCQVHKVECDAAAYLKDLEFPTASPRVMHAERTFWEKATAIHVYCLGGRLPGDKISRHWYDLMKLDEKGLVDKAIADSSLAAEVAQHKSIFFRAKDGAGGDVDYGAAVSGSLKLVPTGKELASLKEDYEAMVKSGLIEKPVAFEKIMSCCRDIETRVNEKKKTARK